MNAGRITTLDQRPADDGAAAPSWRMALFFRHLRSFRHGALRVIDQRGRAHHFGASEAQPAIMTVHDDRMVDRAWRKGSIGFAEAYLDGQFDSPDLLKLLDVFLANEHAFEGRWNGGWLRRALSVLTHGANANTKSGSKRNIAAHYDLGNAFYKEWLDPSMTYSAAIFRGEDEPLGDAQQRKLARMIDRLELEPGMEVLEIGCGWGSFAIKAAKERGVRVTGLTLSKEQHAWASDKVREEGLEDRVEIRLQDYRDVGGAYDRIASIEMFEAVGERYWPTYFQTLQKLLKPGGRCALQVITIAEQFFENYRKNPDFIQLYVFPGGMLPSPAALRRQIEAAGLHVVDRFCFGEDYARTLERWSRAFERAWPDYDAAIGLDERFARLWRYYLAYCQAGFARGAIDVEQVALARAG